MNSPRFAHLLAARLPAFACALALAGLAPVALRAQEARLANLSTRAQAGAGADVLTAGFVIGPGANKQVLVRAVGPSLGAAPFNLPGTLADPVLTIYGPNSSTAVAATNDNWAAGHAATFASVGAFALQAGSRDAAIVTTLAPGAYTAQVSGVNNTTGLVLVEVYEVGATGGKLLNISTRAQVGTGASVMIPGLVVTPGTGTRRLLIRAAGPALNAFGLTGTLADPSITLTTSAGVAVASNNDWGTPAVSTAADAALLSAVAAQAGAFGFASGSRDAALLVDLGAGNYGIQVTGAGGTTGLAIVEVYDVTPTGSAIVTITASKATTDETGASAGEFTVTRSGDTIFPLTVVYGVSGSATNGIDYPPLVGLATIPAGQASAKITLLPYADTTVEATETVTLTLAAGTGYTVGTGAAATVSIADNPGTLYVATLRPASNAAASAASGLATIVLSANGTMATVNVTFSNLSSGQTGAHLFLGNSTSAGDYVLNLPLGQVGGTQWTIGPTGTYTSTQILDALRNGLIYVGLDTTQYPAGELRGSFLTALGSQTFTPPPAPLAVTLTNITAADAARLLTQATFGPRKSEIDALTGGSVNAWIDAQMALPNSGHRTRTFTELAYVPITNNNNPNVPLPSHRQYAWFYNVLQGEDQLRQRVAFALSQILVVSDASLGGQQYTEGLAHYYDTLANGAFGNFRTLLEQVTLSPIMGNYLSHLRNAKADPVTGTNPDENYAREVMQLFSIGLVQLQPDGTLKLDAQGLPIPTYNQTTITEMAKVFTGWSYNSTQANATNSLNVFRRGAADYLTPMMIYAVAHENAAKNLAPVLSTPIPANLGGTEDLRRALDALFNHDNTPAFISRQLIQRLVTDNPSPAYVYRVAERFRNNGAGVRGDLGAVVRAILTDYEARAPAVADDPGYGKLKEPLLRFTGMLRSFNATATGGHYVSNFGNVDQNLSQAALRSPSVFNFFEPGYVYPGALAAAGLVAPEFQITNDTTAISVPNLLRTFAFQAATGANAANIVTLNLTAEQALVTNVPALLDHLAPLLANGQLSTATRTRITTAMSALGANTTALERAQTAVLLVATSPEGATQR